MSGLTQEPPDPPVRERSRGERGDRRGERVPRGRVEHAEERVGDARRGGRAEQRQDDERRRRGDAGAGAGACAAGGRLICGNGVLLRLRVLLALCVRRSDGAVNVGCRSGDAAIGVKHCGVFGTAQNLPDFWRRDGGAAYGSWPTSLSLAPTVG